MLPDVPAVTLPSCHRRGLRESARDQQQRGKPPGHPCHRQRLTSRGNWPSPRLKCCFTSTETVGLLGTGAQDVHLDFHTPPELCCELAVVEVLIYVHRNRRFIRVVHQDVHLDFHTVPELCPSPRPGSCPSLTLSATDRALPVSSDDACQFEAWVGGTISGLSTGGRSYRCADTI